ncbi:DUF4145 domain-containing protein [Hymenobacter psoromatis]|uniref:DUF4145 domain-containing protein n=1 Tax=Hymenobacter psoromatis TaxID=1484116 RepID=UPI001CC039DF|nr:DUF4145 domain-containing protein [Hymenobacter psoromatis]
MSTEAKKIKNYCGNYQNTTNHEVLFAKTQSGDDPDYNYATKYITVQCMGCEHVSFRQENHDYESSYPDEFDNWTHEITTYLYPNPLQNHRTISETYLLPPQIKTVYDETINALKANCHLLAGVGFRAVVEAICLDKNITGRDLAAKINSLARNRFITDKESERLHTVRFMGNDSVHDMSVPKEKALHVLLEIIEHLLSNLYIIDHHAKPVLNTFINTQDDFEDLLLKNLKLFKSGDDLPLAKYLGKDVRRLNGHINVFESQLIAGITSGEFKRLQVGTVKHFGTNTTETFQHFTLV